MSKKVAVVIPTHKEVLNEFEQISLAQCIKVLGHYPIIYAIPEGKNFSWIPEGSNVIHLPHLGKGTDHYNILLKSPQFYETFFEYEYILIYHVDAFVFRDDLEYFCSLGYDYIGAPWPSWMTWIRYPLKTKIMSRVGNGGFCLKNVKAHYDLLVNHPDLIKQFRGNEDVFFSRCGKRADCNFKVAPINVAYQFAAEVNPSRVFSKNGGKPPFGCHKWFAYGADIYTPFFAKLGYDLSPLKTKMRNGNYDGVLRDGLSNEAEKRLNRRLQLRQSISRYLPKRKYSSIRVARSPLAMLILSQLLLENPYLSDKIFIFKPEDQNGLSQNLTQEKEPHLLIGSGGGYDKKLISTIEKKGFNYGNQFVTFHREYLNHCEELFLRLGK